MRYRKKPVVIEAFKWTGGPDQIEDPEWANKAQERGEIWFDKDGTSGCVMYIETLEGVMRASQGDYIIKGLAGEIYPCRPDIFEASYELVEP